MRSALRGVLTVDKRVKLFTILRSVGNHDFNIGADEMDYRIERLVGHILFQEVEQTVARMKFLAVEVDCQARVEKRIVAHHTVDILFAKLKALKEVGVGQKTHIRAVRLIGGIDVAVLYHKAALILHRLALAVAKRRNDKR